MRRKTGNYIEGEYYERERERERAKTVPAPLNSLRLGAFFCKFATELALNKFAILHNHAFGIYPEQCACNGFRKIS
jgi:hypothetical protein